MRIMMKVQIPTAAGNRALADGTLGTTLGEVFGRIRPEAIYHTTSDGERCSYVVFDLTDPTDMPSIAEPLFQRLDARVDVTPCMDQADLEKGLGKLVTS
jgi:hypothetical protein